MMLNVDFTDSAGWTYKTSFPVPDYTVQLTKEISDSPPGKARVRVQAATDGTASGRALLLKPSNPGRSNGPSVDVRPQIKITFAEPVTAPSSYPDSSTKFQGTLQLCRFVPVGTLDDPQAFSGIECADPQTSNSEAKPSFITPEVSRSIDEVLVDSVVANAASLNVSYAYDLENIAGQDTCRVTVGGDGSFTQEGLDGYSGDPAPTACSKVNFSVA